jgi:lysine biosynthesis protein LysW
MSLTMCSQCDREFIVTGTLSLGQPVICPSCGARLQVIWLDPCELEPQDDAPHGPPASESAEDVS